MADLQAIRAVLEQRNQAKTEYDHLQKELEPLVAEYVQQKGGWADLKKIGLREPEIKRYIDRHERRTT